MARYHVVAKTTCYVCLPNRLAIVQDSGIEATDETDAKETFTSKHKLCPVCLGSGIKAAVEFDSYINVEQLPGF